MASPLCKEYDCDKFGFHNYYDCGTSKTCKNTLKKKTLKYGKGSGDGVFIIDSVSISTSTNNMDFMFFLWK